jgi:hypothetical protein
MYYIEYKENNNIKSNFLKDMVNSGYARDGIMYRIKGIVPLHKPFISRTTKNVIELISFMKKPYLLQ